ncbi:MAG: DUF4149 domain-containing protein [Pseudomonadota bacterium]
MVNESNDIWLFATLTIAVLWLGAVIGVSMIATPVKFQAASLTFPVALDVGRVTFRLFTKIELVIGILLAVAMFAYHKSVPAIWPAAVLLAIVLMQGFWLLPILAERTNDVIRTGVKLPPSNAHHIYVVLEMAKMLLLGFIGWRMVSAVRAAIIQS